MHPGTSLILLAQLLDSQVREIMYHTKMILYTLVEEAKASVETVKFLDRMEVPETFTSVIIKVHITIDDSSIEHFEIYSTFVYFYILK